MMVDRFLARLRAAHALSFAMTGGIAPDMSGLDGTGLDGVDPQAFRIYSRTR